MLSESGTENKVQDKGLKILTFHKIIHHFSFGSTNYSPTRFARIHEYLKFNNYRFGSITDAMNSDNDPFFLAVSFDDGYQHLLDNLPPLMEKYNYRPTVFMPTHYTGKVNDWDYSYRFQTVPHLDREGIKILAKAGVEFGTHGHSHCDLRALPIEKLKSALLEFNEVSIFTDSYAEIMSGVVCAASTDLSSPRH